MTRAQRDFIKKTLSVLGWLAVALYVSAVLAVAVVNGPSFALLGAFYFSPAVLVGIVLLWVRRFLSLGDSGAEESN